MNIKKTYIIIIIVLIILSSIPLYNTLTNYTKTSNTLTSTNNNYEEREKILNDYTILLEEINQSIQQLKAGDKYNLNDPSYNIVIDFLTEDKTDENTYDDQTYNCAHFARDVNNNADEKQIRCAYVYIMLKKGTPHTCVAFNTTDQGLVFFEPQNDNIVNLEIGKDYWSECMEPGEYRGSGNEVASYTLYW